MELELLEPPALNHSVAETVVPVRAMEHRELRRDDFWSAIPAYAATRADEFHTHTFQARPSVTNVRQLCDTLRQLVPDSFYEDVAEGIRRAPMALRFPSLGSSTSSTRASRRAVAAAGIRRA